MNDPVVDAKKMSSYIFKLDANLEKILKHVECSICQEVTTEPTTVSCGHSFCDKCLRRALSEKECKGCPLCKQNIKRRGLSVDQARSNISLKCRDLVESFLLDVKECEERFNLETFTNLKLKLLSPVKLPDNVKNSKQKSKTKAQEVLCEMPQQKTRNLELPAIRRTKKCIQYPSPKLKNDTDEDKLISVSQVETMDLLLNIPLKGTLDKIEIEKQASGDKISDWLNKTDNNFDVNETLPSIFAISPSLNKDVEQTKNETNKFSKPSTSMIRVDYNKIKLTREQKSDDPYEFIPSQHSRPPKMTQKARRSSKRKQPGCDAVQTYSKESILKTKDDELITASQKFDELWKETEKQTKQSEKHKLFTCNDEISQSFLDLSQPKSEVPVTKKMTKRTSGRKSGSEKVEITSIGTSAKLVLFEDSPLPVNQRKRGRSKLSMDCGNTEFENKEVRRVCDESVAIENETKVQDNLKSEKPANKTLKRNSNEVKKQTKQGKRKMSLDLPTEDVEVIEISDTQSEEKHSPKRRKSDSLVGTIRSPGWSRVGALKNEFKSPKRQVLKSLNISGGELSLNTSVKRNSADGNKINSEPVEEIVQCTPFVIDDSENTTQEQPTKESNIVDMPLTKNEQLVIKRKSSLVQLKENKIKNSLKHEKEVRKEKLQDSSDVELEQSQSLVNCLLQQTVDISTDKFTAMSQDEIMKIIGGGPLQTDKQTVNINTDISTTQKKKRVKIVSDVPVTKVQTKQATYKLKPRKMNFVILSKIEKMKNSSSVLYLNLAFPSKKNKKNRNMVRIQFPRGFVRPHITSTGGNKMEKMAQCEKCSCNIAAQTHSSVDTQTQNKTNSTDMCIQTTQKEAISVDVCIQTTPKQTRSADMCIQTTQKLPSDMCVQTTQKLATDMCVQTTQKITTDMFVQTTQKLPIDVCVQTTQKLPTDISVQTTQKLPTDMCVQTTQKLPTDMCVQTTPNILCDAKMQTTQMNVNNVGFQTTQNNKTCFEVKTSLRNESQQNISCQFVSDFEGVSRHNKTDDWSNSIEFLGVGSQFIQKSSKPSARRTLDMNDSKKSTQNELLNDSQLQKNLVTSWNDELQSADAVHISLRDSEDFIADTDVHAITQDDSDGVGRKRAKKARRLPSDDSMDDDDIHISQLTGKLVGLKPNTGLEKNKQNGDESDSDMFVEQTPPRNPQLNISLSQWKSIPASQFVKQKETERDSGPSEIAPTPPENIKNTVVILSSDSNEIPEENKFLEHAKQTKSFPSRDTFFDEKKSSPFLKPGERGISVIGPRRTSSRFPSPEITKLRRGKLCVVASVVHNRENVENFARKFNMEYSAVPVKHMTHLVVGLHEEDNKMLPQCTYKFLYALAHKKWIVSEAWLQCCMRENSIVSEEKFESCDPRGGIGCRLARTSVQPLFADFEVYLMGEFSMMTREQFEDILVASGATIKEEITRFTLVPSKYRIIIYDSDSMKHTEKQLQSMYLKYQSVVLSYEFVTQSIQFQKLENFTAHLLCGATEEEMIKLGYPLLLAKYEEDSQWSNVAT